MAAAGAALLLTAAPNAARAAYIANGDFEAPPLGTGVGLFPSWTNGSSSGSDAPAPIGGAHSAKLVFASSGSLNQATTNQTELGKYVFEADFALSDSGANRSFQLNLRTDPSTSAFQQINLRVVDADGNHTGDIQVYDNSSWTNHTPAALANTVAFSASDTALQVNHLKLAVDYTGASGPSYNLTISGPALSAPVEVDGLAAFHGTAPTASSVLKVVSFESGNFPAGAFAVVDNVMLAGTPVPEPAAIGLMSIAAAAAFGRRRR